MNTNVMQSDLPIDRVRALIDHGASQGPNWWMAAIAIVAFAIMILGVIRGAKWIIGRHEALTNDLRESNKQQVQLLTGVVEKNTMAWMTTDARVAAMDARLASVDNSVNQLRSDAQRMSLRKDQQQQKA